MAEVNYLEFLNKMDHNQLVRLLNDHGLLEKGVLTLEDIASVAGNWVLELEGHHPRNCLKKINDRLQTSTPTVATPALPSTQAVRSISPPQVQPLDPSHYHLLQQPPEPRPPHLMNQQSQQNEFNSKPLLN